MYCTLFSCGIVPKIFLVFGFGGIFLYLPPSERPPSLPKKMYLINFNFLQILCKEVKAILLYQGFPKPILPTKHQKRSEGWFLCKIGRV